MKKLSIITLALFCTIALSAKKTQQVDSLGNKIKTGWNFGVLPSVAYDADYGFQGGALGNVYYYGDGSQYPEYIHSIYFEAAYTTKQNGILRLNYDSKYLIPGHRLTMDATFLPTAMNDFYGFNGYQSVFNSGWAKWKKDINKMPDYEQYRSRVFYKQKRDLIRFAADIEGTIWHNFKWNAGVGVLGYIIQASDVDMLNGKRQFTDSLPRYQQKALDPSVEGLYKKYCDWGLISADEKNGGWHPYARVGVSFDSRNKRQGPTKGIYTDLFFTYSAAFNANYGQQASAGYNHLQLNFTFRHYVPVYRDRVTFAYRIGTQNVIAGKSPYYMNTYLNTLFIQRVIYEGLGGGNSLRGVLANRILADGFLYATAEFRCRVVNFDIGRQHFFVGLNPFFDFGLITQPCQISEEQIRTAIQNNNIRLVAEGQQPDDINDYFSFSKADLYRPHMAAGLGLKIGMNENFVVSCDWAMPVNEKYYLLQDNNKWANFYIKMGYLF